MPNACHVAFSSVAPKFTFFATFGSPNEGLLCIIFFSFIQYGNSHYQITSIIFLKKSNNTKSSYEVNLLYPAQNHTSRNTSTEASITRIYEVGHLNDRQIILKWVQKLHGLGN